RNIVGAPLNWSPTPASFGQRDRLYLRCCMSLANRLVFRPMLRNELAAVLIAEQAGCYRHGTAGIDDMHHRLGVVRGDLDRRMRAARSCSADQKRKFELLALHLSRDVDHLFEGRRDQAAESD